MSRSLSRRAFLRNGAAALPLLGSTTNASAADERRDASRLVADPKGILDLPPGFSYRVLTRVGDAMSDGYRTPGKCDAMGVFEGELGRIVIMRNHEVAVGEVNSGPFAEGQPHPPEAHDPEAYGGVTRIELDPDTLEITRTNLVLVGTHWNCAGGLSPWGWLSCEENFSANHGYVFLCPTNATQVAPARPIKAYGRFRHEAATADPRTHIAYLTEDMEGAAFYRFVPHDRADPFVGKLQALAVRGAPRFITSTMSVGEKQLIHWVDIDEPDPHQDTVRLQAHARGAAAFRRTEGLWLAGDDLYLTATSGGPISRGQIFRVRHQPEDAAEIELIAHSEDPSVLDMPDNITVSPHGHVYFAEDGYEGNFLQRLTLEGRIIPFARNALSASELAGPCFSPDGSTMFVNIQHDGLTLAIRGPFAKDAARDVGKIKSNTTESSRRSTGVLGIGGGLAVLALAALARRKRERA